ncbi:glucose-1-phosphate thymidylyltransferase [Acetobacteraceae bacterium]|nr:glucose-1-phosphate thymidylyltransferase [Acetobacteraceae bacterium]
MTETKDRKGILLAGGHGTRLRPLTTVISKHLLPLYDKPIIFYPLSSMILAGLSEIMLITTPEEAGLYKKLLGDGSEFGIKLVYKEQAEPAGIAQALLIAEEWLDGAPSMLMLGDNILLGTSVSERLKKASDAREGATVFAHQVRDPERYGVVSFDSSGKPIEIIEKPQNPASSWIVTGVYFYDGEAPKIARGLKPSARNELEITDINHVYLEKGVLTVERLGQGYSWMDVGMPEPLLRGAELVKGLQDYSEHAIGSPLASAYQMGRIDKKTFEDGINKLGKTCLARLLRNELHKGIF